MGRPMLRRRMMRLGTTRMTPSLRAWGACQQLPLRAERVRVSVQQPGAKVRWFQHGALGDQAPPGNDPTERRAQSTFLQSVDLSNMTVSDRQRLSKLIQEVVTTKANTGDFVPQVVIENLCSKYRTLAIDGKKQFLLILARDLHVDVALVRQSLRFLDENLALVEQADEQAVDWQHEHLERFLRSFRTARQSLSPLHETFFQQILSQREDGMLFLVQLRADLLQILRKNPQHNAESSALRSLDASLKNFLASWFSVGFLKLERVTYEHSPGRLLEKIIRYEAVHPVGTIIELKRRLGRGRRCFAFFHPSVPDEPLVFVHVALVKELASSMHYIREETEHMTDETKAKAAIFYSISSTQKGLQGVDLGNFLIKEVAKALKTEHMQLETFATLSPIPQFVQWLESRRGQPEGLVSKQEIAVVESALRNTKIDHSIDTSQPSPLGVVLDTIALDTWFEDPALEAALKPLLMRLGAHYIYNEKKRAKALCQVANFHIRNGAIFERLNWLADPSPKGLRQSAGLMVNYKYDLAQVEANNENYLLHNVINIGAQPQALLSQSS
ncbi:TPA: hypothetical protein N0F65_008681 [Lagenidium giganteum]|uniref:Malonyl-CoA decarboxylase n=1 Tax=Lagenidium giganteum TaxID=4803 RepID=A0AAV2Z6X5_9STRA|nr:TPA: hypothetical protein N0F65_008681 [Lagenidium giganteum]